MKNIGLFSLLVLLGFGCSGKNNLEVTDPLHLNGAAVQEDEVGESQLAHPLEQANEREKKLTFGLYVTPDPEQNPIDPPERFTGFHTGLDFEIFENEQDKDVPVYSICSGKVRFSGFVSGYGGVLVEECLLDNEVTTVLYGHLRPSSLNHSVGEMLHTADRIGVLGDAYTKETDQNRKHLHLGIHKGAEIVFQGYVQTEEELTDFINASPLLGYE